MFVIRQYDSMVDSNDLQQGIGMSKHKTMVISSKEYYGGEEGGEGREGLKEKMEDGEQQAQMLKVELKKSIRGFKAYYWLYFFFAFTTVCQTIVLFAWDLIASILNILLPKFGITKIKRTSYFACLIIFGCTLIVQDLIFFDVSALYHFFRGQNTVKLYSVGLSIMIFQIMLTTTGKTYLGKLPKIIINSQTKPSQIYIQLALSFLYSIAHFFIIYIDFILFVIILNSTSNSRFLFLFGMNISKLKTSVFKKFDKKIYKNGLLFDAKDRFFKITFSVILILTLEERIDLSMYLTILKALAFTSAIDYLRNLTTLSLGGELNYIKDIRNRLFEECYLKSHSLNRHESIMKCLELDFTVIPYILFLFKFIHIIFKETKKLDFNLIITNIFALLIGYTLVARFAVWLLRKLWQQKKAEEKLAQI